LVEAMTADWQQFVELYSGEQSKELDLDSLLPGDTLRVITSHTQYVFQMIDRQEAELRSSRSDRPTGRVRIAGCGFGFASSFKPRRLFCGGRLEFTFARDNERARFRTTSIQAILHRQTKGELGAAC
jgi:hypothetical protein